MKVSVKLFAAARELAGADSVAVTLAEGATLGDLRRELQALYPALAPLLPHVMFALDSEYAGDETPLREQTEIACIPPVSGG